MDQLAQMGHLVELFFVLGGSRSRQQLSFKVEFGQRCSGLKIVQLENGRQVC